MNNNYDPTLYNPKYNQHIMTNPQLYIHDLQPDEIFIELLYNNILCPEYTISNYGRMWSMKWYRLLAYTPDKDGYARVGINVPGLGYKTAGVHRVEMQSFYPIDEAENYKYYVVNHKDGNIYNLRLDNLEWTSSLGNTRHARNNGMIPADVKARMEYQVQGNYEPDVSIKSEPGKPMHPEAVHYICAMIDAGYDNKQICDHFRVFERKERLRLLATLRAIRQLQAYAYIAKEYEFGKNYRRLEYKPLFGYLLCKVLSDGNSYTFDDLIRMFEIAPEDRQNFWVLVDRVLNHQTFKDISDQYQPLTRPINMHLK